jgi:hypothetical protein
VPEQTAKADIQQSTGKAKYDAKRNAIIWKIKRFNGAQVQHFMASTLLHYAFTGLQNNHQLPAGQFAMQFATFHGTHTLSTVRESCIISGAHTVRGRGSGDNHTRPQALGPTAHPDELSGGPRSRGTHPAVT